VWLAHAVLVLELHSVYCRTICVLEGVVFGIALAAPDQVSGSWLASGQVVVSAAVAAASSCLCRDSNMPQVPDVFEGRGTVTFVTQACHACLVNSRVSAVSCMHTPQSGAYSNVLQPAR
jgi:hypothetical protein